MASATPINKNIKKGMYWVTDLQTMVQRQDMDKIPDNACVLTMNCSHDKPGTISKRKGSALTGTTQAGNGVYGLIDYIKNDDTHTLHAVRSTNLDSYDAIGDVWNTLDAGQFTASTKIASVNYKNKVYHVSGSDVLQWENGSAATAVGGANDQIKATSLAVAQNTLFVGGATYGNGGAQNWQDRVYYTLYDTTNNVPGEQLWNDAEADLVHSTRFLTMGAPVKALYAFGATGLVYIFTPDSCYSFDMRYEDTATGVQKVFDIGCANPRAVTQCNGFMVWMSPDKRIWAWGGAGVPMELSWDIEDDTYEEAVINVIDNAQVAEVCAGSVRNKFYFSIGNITLKGETYNNVVLRGLVNQGFTYVIWGLEMYPVKPVIFSNMVLDNKKVLCFGAGGVDDIYVMGLGANDGATAINAFFRTKFYDFNAPYVTKDQDRMLVKFRPQAVNDTFLRVMYAVDSKYSYTAITDPDAISPVTEHGVIDMYRSDYATNRDMILPIQMPQGTNFRSISYEFGNNKINESFEISGFGSAISARPLDVLPEGL